jgi:hypothetical protein
MRGAGALRMTDWRQAFFERGKTAPIVQLSSQVRHKSLDLLLSRW